MKVGDNVKFLEDYSLFNRKFTKDKEYFVYELCPNISPDAVVLIDDEEYPSWFRIRDDNGEREYFSILSLEKYFTHIET